MQEGMNVVERNGRLQEWADAETPPKLVPMRSCCQAYGSNNHKQEDLFVKLNLPLVEYGEEEFRVGYLLQSGETCVIQPIGPVGSIPEKVRVPVARVKMLNHQGQVIAEPVSVPADAGEVEVKLEKERIKTMAEKAKKSTKKEAKPASVKYLVLTDKAPDTKDLKEGSHAYAIIVGLRKLSTGGVQGKATRDRLMETITSNKLIKTDMEVSKAISWMLGQLKAKGAVKVVTEAA